MSWRCSPLTKLHGTSRSPQPARRQLHPAIIQTTRSTSWRTSTTASTEMNGAGSRTSAAKAKCRSRSPRPRQSTASSGVAIVTMCRATTTDSPRVTKSRSRSMARRGERSRPQTIASPSARRFPAASSTRPTAWHPPSPANSRACSPRVKSWRRISLRQGRFR